MPVAPIARQARGLEAEHRPDETLADLADEAAEAGPIGRAAGGAPEILVDHPDVLEPVRAGQVHEPVLPTLALEVLLHLTPRRLPDIHHGAAAQHGRGEVTTHHCPPRAVRRVARPPAGDAPVWR